MKDKTESRAYNEIYIEDSMRNLGTAFDFAKNSYGIEMDDFYLLFIHSGIARQFGSGNVKYVTGMSGIELVLEVLKDHEEVRYSNDYIKYDYSCEFWCGWILAYFQWYYAIGFRELRYYLKMSDLEGLYTILHEVSETKAVEVISNHIRNKNLKTKLQSYRQAAGLSQNELAEGSGVSLRMVQQYEQRQKDINKASAISLYALARVLNRDLEELLEWDFEM
ncbi:MAG: helix-turn-helix transcriptional regulator [Oscillospiraceae bacterium]|nr:helix-turn-helix transcriptional regulator [Erysipelotrichaceae bacterium]MBQ6149315.1 helix-turn-helix transcriptional regulator [Oscillospiraceae bacterium]MBQ6494174.1 helix-turn-helix transcriptional regulator [Erysipelotrichaceae bacterium]